MEIVQEKTMSKILCYITNHKSISGFFHWHENCEICQVINKPCRFLIDGNIVTANVGDIVVINEYDVHQFLVDEDDTKIRIIQFNLSLFINLEVPLKPLKTHIKYDELKRVPNLEKHLNNLFEIMEDENKIINNGNENPFLQNIAISLYYILMRNFSEAKNNRKKKKEREEFHKIVGHIKEHYTEDITVSKMAKMFYISRTKLSLLFKKYSGICINEYINSLRIKKANLLLTQGNNITDAAFESGFQSIRTFNDTYKKHLGITPSEYLKIKSTKS